MAFSSTTLLSLTLYTIFAIVPLAKADLLVGGILGGVLTCTNTSIVVAETYNVIPQAKVDVVCGAGGTSLPTVIKSTQTDTTGLYTFLFTSLDTISIDSGKCYLNVTLPPNSCILNIPTGFLKIPVVVLSIVDALIGRFIVLVGTLSWVTCVSYRKSWSGWHI
ncbi:Hypothetical predicted protein [Olea europaea subsp. europaea]|uniref:Uncharacterized protein n=1 Tax=Olea europaea subsp. europaea TaxID=158383 RepID=A0A8S0V8E1_OLEEU|nr:Hypothetical predicted protein [Olea europaea subsp. europaea]